ncbi:cytochrome P450 [Xylariaceae sp. FL1272]|nr:cytochrome P450 [Xylariaceae sp. FL1272]
MAGFLEQTRSLPLPIHVLAGLGFALIAVLATSITVRRFVVRSNLRRQGYLQDINRKSIPELGVDSRFERFSHGYNVSKSGGSLSEKDPFLVWNGTTPEIVLTQAEHVKEFYSRRSGEHCKPQNANMGHYWGRVMGVCAGAQNGAVWKAIRKVFDPYFSHEAAMKFADTFESELVRWREELAPKAGKTATNFTVEATTACRILPFKLIAQACYGEVLTDAMFAELLELNELHEKVMMTSWFGSSTRSKLYCMLPTQHKRDMDEFVTRWADYNLRAARECNAKGIRCPVGEMHAEVVKGTISEDNWLQTIDEILFTNLDVTSAILAFLLINLAINQSAQKELREEVLANGGSQTKMDTELLGKYIKKSDTLLEYTCMESTRLSPATWFTLPEYVTEDLEIGGYRIKAGTCCIIDWTRLNIESGIWTPTKEKGLIPGTNEQITGQTFWPQRFRQLTPLQYRWSMLRFGLGGRHCIGKNFASLIMKQFLVQVLTHYELELAGDTTRRSFGAINVNLREDRFTIMPNQDVKFTAI